VALPQHKYVMNVYPLKALFVALSISLSISGCADDIREMFPGNQPIPPETVSELMVRGASLGSVSPRHRPLPDDIGVRVVTDNPQMIDSGSLSVTILSSDFVESNYHEGRFVYAFSQSIGDDVYQLLLNHRFAVDGVPVKTFLDLYRDDLYPGMESLSETASFVLVDSPFFLPMNATHLELHFVPTSNQDVEPVFVQRWGLTGFYAYDRYLAPLIE